MIDGVPYGIASRWIYPDRRPLRNTTRQRCDQARIVGDQLRLAVEPVDPLDPLLPGEVAG